MAEDWLIPERDQIPRTGTKIIEYLKDVCWAAVISPACAIALDILIEAAFHSNENFAVVFISMCLAAVAVFRRHRLGKIRTWSMLAWVLPALWLLADIVSESHYLPASEGLWRFVRENYFSNNCGSTECLGILFFTLPFCSSLAYSATALILRWRHPGESTAQRS